MLRAEKDHYSLIELVERWKIPFKDIEYHTERDRLEVRTWLGDVVAIRYTFMKMADGEEVPVQQGIITLKGYYVVAGDELRKIYRAPGIPEIRKFFSLDRREIYTLYHQHEAYKINLTALEVSRPERDRFEADLKICARLVPKSKMNIAATATGRPSVMNLVLEHFKNRAAQGRLKETITAESKYLEGWAQKKLGPSHAPIAKTIANNIRPLFGQRRDS